MLNDGGGGEILKKNQILISREAELIQLRTKLTSGEIKTGKKLRPNDWAEDIFSAVLRSEVSKETMNFIKTNSYACDPIDLQLQVVFRLTTFKMEEIKEKLSETIKEQYAIIENRLRNSILPLKKLLLRLDIFDETGWKIKLNEGKIYAVNNDSNEKRRTLLLELREVDVNYARAVFQDLHYIHTPRADLALGLFISGEDLPFSVIGLTKIDRDYKKNVLLIEGYDYEKCWDIARLYNRIGSPKNTSSLMLSQAIKHLKRNYPDSQACLTAVTPSFATGKSMVGGGFEDPVLAKELTLTFGQIKIGDSIYYERLTQRRLDDYHGTLITSQYPLLPMFELITRLQKPVYTPLITSEEMVIMNKD